MLVWIVIAATVTKVVKGLRIFSQAFLYVIWHALGRRVRANRSLALRVRLDRVSNDGYKSCRGLRIYSRALLWNYASCRRRVRALRSLSDLSLALSSNATTLNHLIRLRGSQGIQIWKQRTRIRTRARPSRLRAIAARKPRDETRPSGGEIAEKQL